MNGEHYPNSVIPCPPQVGFPLRLSTVFVVVEARFDRDSWDFIQASPQGAAGAAYGLLFVIILNVQFLLLPRRGNIIGVPGMC